MGVHVRQCEVHNSAHIHGTYVKYKTIGDDEPVQTKTIKGSLSPTYDHSRVVGIDKITQDHLDFFDTGSITFFVYAGQMTNPTEPTAMKLTTKELRERDGQMSDRLAQKEKRIQDICREFEAKAEANQKDFD